MKYDFFPFSTLTISFILRKYFRTRRDDPYTSLDAFKTTSILPNNTDAHIDGLRVELADKVSYSKEGIPEILFGRKAVIRLFGTGITEDTLITFTDVPAERGTVCDKIKSNEFQVSIMIKIHY